LVTVEVLIDRTQATAEEVSMKCVIKNEELPLQVNNHCYKMFEQIHQALIESSHWKLVETVTQ
jgi:hypothetical protein